MSLEYTWNYNLKNIGKGHLEQAYIHTCMHGGWVLTQ